MCQKGALAQARALADAKDMNVDFIEGDATGLVFANNRPKAALLCSLPSVLEHAADLAGIPKEMKRIINRVAL